MQLTTIILASAVGTVANAAFERAVFPTVAPSQSPTNTFALSMSGVAVSGNSQHSINIQTPISTTLTATVSPLKSNVIDTGHNTGSMPNSMDPTAITMSVTTTIPCTSSELISTSVADPVTASARPTTFVTVTTCNCSSSIAAVTAVPSSDLTITIFSTNTHVSTILASSNAAPSPSLSTVGSLFTNLNTSDTSLEAPMPMPTSTSSAIDSSGSTCAFESISSTSTTTITLFETLTSSHTWTTHANSSTEGSPVQASSTSAVMINIPTGTPIVPSIPVSIPYNSTTHAITISTGAAQSPMSSATVVPLSNGGAAMAAADSTSFATLVFGIAYLILRGQSD